MTTGAYTFEFADGYLQDAPLSYDKGCASGVLRLREGNAFSLYFVTLERLAQDAADEIFEQGYYTEENMLIVADVEENTILSVVREVVASGRTGGFNPNP